MDFLEVVVESTQSMVKKHQETLRLILEAAKISEQRVDDVLKENREEVRFHIILYPPILFCAFYNIFLFIYCISHQFFWFPTRLGVQSRVYGVFGL